MLNLHTKITYETQFWLNPYTRYIAANLYFQSNFLIFDIKLSIRHRQMNLYSNTATFCSGMVPYFFELYVHEVVTHFIYLLYKMGHYFLDIQQVPIADCTRYICRSSKIRGVPNYEFVHYVIPWFKEGPPELTEGAAKGPELSKTPHTP